MHADDLNEELLTHLVGEFKDRGRRAVDFLRTAAALLDLEGEGTPRRPEAVAYCLREALKTIPESHGPRSGGLWRVQSRKVAEAKQRFELIRGLPGEDVEGAFRALLDSIDELALTHQQETIHQKRLIAVMMDRAGPESLASGGTNPVNTYQDLVARLDQALHNDVTPDAALGMWREALAILRQLFFPPDARRRELAKLAEVARPTEADVYSLRSLVATQGHLRFFLGEVNTADWLDALDAADLLTPPREEDTWPVAAAVERLGKTEGVQLADFLAKAFDRWGDNPNQAWHIAREATGLGPHGHDLLLRAARKHPHCALFATHAARTAEPDSQFVRDTVDVVVSRALQSSIEVYLKPLLDTYVSGVTTSTYIDRIRLLCYKLNKVPEQDKLSFLAFRGGAIADPIQFREEDIFPSLLRAFLDSLRRAADFATAPELLDAVDALPTDIRDRIRAWVLATWGSSMLDLMIAEITDAISRRSPTGDDLALVDRVVDQCGAQDFTSNWATALGKPPATSSVGKALSAREVPETWVRSFHWTAVLPAPVVASWTVVAAVLANTYGQPQRSSLEHRPRATGDWGRSPMTEADLNAMSPDDAARRIATWRKDPADWLVGPHELAQVLEAVVKADPSRWAATPVVTGSLLREPTYISHYLRGLASADSLVGVPVTGLVDLIQLCATHPWEPRSLGDPTFDYDVNWEEVEAAAVDLIKKLANQDTGFDGRDDAVWAFLSAQAHDRDHRGQDLNGDPMTQAINRPCTRALEAVFVTMGHDFRDHGAVRPETLDLLAKTLTLAGLDGLQHRAIIAPRLAFLRHVASDWVDAHRGELLGTEAPDNLGQVTVDLSLSWGRPDTWLLEHHREQVQDAVRRDVPHALDRLLVAVLRQVPGFTVETAATFLRSVQMISGAGEALGRLLRGDDVAPDLLTVAVQFWERAISFGDSESLAGFGWHAEITSLDDATWTALTRQTLEITRGHIRWGRYVAKRAARLDPSSDTLEILNLLVRGLPDSWDRRDVLDTASHVVETLTSPLTTTPEYQRLRTATLERGAELPPLDGNTDPGEPTEPGPIPQPDD